MMHTLRRWLTSLWQALKVLGLRRYYRVSSARAWRGQPAAVAFTDLRIPLDGVSIGARLYNNELGGQQPLIVYFHGGGWVIGDLETHHPFCQALSQSSGCSVIALDYRLAPEHVFPAALEDCLGATHWIAQSAAVLGTNNTRLVIAGDSAGGNLAACVCLEVDPACRERIAGQALIYPATDHYSGGFASYIDRATGQVLTTSLMQWFWDTYLGGQSAQAPAVQRAFPLRSSRLASLPPTLLITAQNDPLRDEGKAYGDKLQLAGVPVSSHHFATAAHGFACSEGPHADFRGFMQHFITWLAQLD